MFRFVIMYGSMFAGACAPLNSGDLATNELIATFTIVADDDGATANVQLSRLASGEQAETVALTGDDELRVESGDASEPLVRAPQELFQPPAYVGALDASVLGESVDVVFARADVELRSTVLVPSLTVVAAPADGASFSRADGLVIEVGEPGEDLFFVDLQGPCTAGWTETCEAGTGRVDISFDASVGGACDLEVTVTRLHFGNADSRFGSALITSERKSDRFTLHATP